MSVPEEGRSRLLFFFSGDHPVLLFSPLSHLCSLFPAVLMVIINCHASGSGAGSEWKIGIAGAELQEESSAITAAAAAAE